MRLVVLATALVLAGCVTPAAQKVTVLLTSRTITCNDTEAGRIAILQLDQEDDFYQVARVLGDDTYDVLGSTRDGLTVTFDCPASVDSLPVRHATILQSRVNAPPTGNAPPPAGSEGGSAPPPT